jgi:hypothetical protein
VCRELDQERLERSAIPLREHLAGLRRRQAEAAVQHVVGLRDELHVAVLDAVVHHLDEMPGPVGTDVRHARSGLRLRRDGLEHVLDPRPRRGGAARHDRRAEARAFFAARDTAADEVQPLIAQGGLAAAGVGEVRVAAVDDDVVRLEQRRQLAEHLVDRGAGGDHHHDAARPFERAHQILEALRAGELVAGVILEEGVGPVGLEVPHRDRKAVLLDVEREVAAHRAEADDGEAAATHT